MFAYIGICDHDHFESTTEKGVGKQKRKDIKSVIFRGEQGKYGSYTITGNQERVLRGTRIKRNRIVRAETTQTNVLLSYAQWQYRTNSHTDNGENHRVYPINKSNAQLLKTRASDSLRK